jgi:hypothetical protein
MAAKDCHFHGEHSLQIQTNKDVIRENEARNEAKHKASAAERLKLREKDEEIEQMFNKYKWIGIGFATCFTVVTTITSALVAAGWWLLGNPSVVQAALQLRGNQ